MVNLFDPETLVKGYGCVALSCEQNNYLIDNIKTFPYVRTKKYLSKITEVKDITFLVTFGTAVWVKEKLIDIDTGKVYLRLGYRVGDDEKEKIFDSSILNQWGIKELLQEGVRFYDRNASDVVSYLIMDEENAPVKYVYSKLGWSITDDSIVFKSGTVHNTNGACESKYRGELQLFPQGRLNNWLQTIRNEVLNNTPLEFVMLLGFASPILAYLNTKFDIGAMMFNLSNRSSRGKTTAAMLATSVFSNPVLNKGTAITYNATENALVQFVSRCMGHTVVFDEVAISASSDFSRLLYTLCNGRSKMRLNGDATQKPVHEFNSIIISTAEFDLLNDDSPAGLKARVFGIKDELTHSAENSDNIKRCIIENYAVAGGPFIETVLKNIGNITDDYERDKKFLISECENIRDLSERIFSKLAVILMTARYFNTTFPDCQVDIEKLTEYILGLEKSITDEINQEDRFIEIIKQEYAKSNNKYILKKYSKAGIDDYTPSNCVGAAIVTRDYTEMQMIESEFNRIISAYKIVSVKSILKNLKTIGILQTEKDRLFKRIVLIKALGRQKCYCFRLKPEQNEIKCETPKVTDDELLDIDNAFDDLAFDD